MILGSLVEVLNEENNSYGELLKKKKKKFRELNYYDRERANSAWLHDRMDDVADYAKEKPGEYIGTLVGTGVGAVMGGVPGAVAGAAIGDLGVRGVKAAGRYLDSIGRYRK